MPSLFRRFPAQVWILFAGRILTAGGFAFGFPFFALYASSVLHESGWRIGIALLVSGLIGSVAKYVGGERSDVWGRKAVMQIALLGRAVTSALIAYVIWKRLGFLPLTASLVASNFFGQLFEPSSQALVSDITTPRNRTEAFGLVRMGINLGWALGLFLHSYLARSYAAAFACTAAVFVLSSVVIGLTIREPARVRQPVDAPRVPKLAFLANRAFVGLCLGSALISVVWAQLVATTSVYVTRHVGIAEEKVGSLLAVNGALVFLLQLPLARLSGQIGLVRALVCGCLCYAAGYGSYGLCSQTWQFAIAIAIFTCGENLVAPASASLAALLAPAERGRYLGIWGLVSNLGFSVGPLLGGWLLDTHPGPSPIPWAIISGIAIVAAAVFLTLPRVSEPPAPVVPPPTPHHAPTDPVAT